MVYCCLRELSPEGEFGEDGWFRNLLFSGGAHVLRTFDFSIKVKHPILVSQWLHFSLLFFSRENKPLKVGGADCWVRHSI